MGHHLSTELASSHPQLDLTDVYAFESDRPGKTCLVMIVNPKSTPGDPANYSAHALYKFHLGADKLHDRGVTYTVRVRGALASAGLLEHVHAARLHAGLAGARVARIGERTLRTKPASRRWHPARTCSRTDMRRKSARSGTHGRCRLLPDGGVAAGRARGCRRRRVRRVEFVQVRHTVEQCALAGRVRADEGADDTAPRVKAGAFNRGDAAEAHRQPVDVQRTLCRVPAGRIAGRSGSSRVGDGRARGPQSLSTMVTLAMPPPSHMVCRP